MNTSHPQNPIRVGIFQDLGSADRAVHELVQAGFSRDAISVICPTCSAGELSEVQHVEPAGAHVPGAAAVGGAIGGLLGGLTAAAGIFASGGALLLVAGTLLGGAATGGVAGAFIGAMTTRGFTPEIANFYDQALTRGQILVAVDTQHGGPEERAELAERVLAGAGAEPVPLPKG